MSELGVFLVGAFAGAGVLWLLGRTGARAPSESAPTPSESVPRPPEAATAGDASTPSAPPPATASAPTEPDPLRWRPPYVAGTPLQDWARSVTRGVVREAIAEGDESDAAVRIAEGLSPVVRQAMLPDATPEDRARAVPCSALGQGTVGVTAPEAIALAEWVRTRLDAEDLQALVDDVTLCDEWLANGATASPCAMQGPDHVCLAYEAQPFACRPTLAASLAAQLRQESGVPDGARVFTDVHAETVGQGVAEGLSEGLEQAGLDATVYELHSALRRALGRRDAAQAWARGEPVFDGCRRLASPDDRPVAVPLGLPPRPVVPRPA